MDQIKYAYPDHVLLIQPSQFEKEIIRGVFGKEPLLRPVVEIEYKSSKRTGCNPIILTALNEIKIGLQELKGLAPEVMTTDEAAAYLNRAPNTIRQLCRLELFPYFVFPGKDGKPGDRMFFKAWIDQWIKERGFNVPEDRD